VTLIVLDLTLMAIETSFCGPVCGRVVVLESALTMLMPRPQARSQARARQSETSAHGGQSVDRSMRCARN
jgi:hypothetical protein